jgi:putative FmdB family regulatory protein
MPLFDFTCTKCGNVFEFLRSFGSKAKPPCPACGSKKTEKKIAPPAVHFKGSGFYKTDSVPSKPKKAPEKKESKPAAEESKKDTATSHSKPLSSS